jgi:hypothetical protein
MFSRFGGALILVVLISLAGITLEKRILSLRRKITLQTYQLDEFLEQHAIHRLRTQQLGAPSRLIDAVDKGDQDLSQTTQSPLPPSEDSTAQNADHLSPGLQ